MGTIALSLPQTGLPNSTEDVKVTNDLTLIQNVINGNLDASNLSTTSGIMRLGVVVAASNYAANYGDLVNANGVGITVTLPAPRSNAMVCVWNSGGSGASPTVVSGTNIYGAGLSAATSFKLGALGAFAVLQSDGASWLITGGQQDTGWVALTLNAGIPITAVAGQLTPSARLRGDMVNLKGAMQSGNSSVPPITWATLPVAVRPSVNLAVLAWSSSAGASQITLQTGGSLVAADSVNGNQLTLDGLQYALS